MNARVINRHRLAGPCTFADLFLYTVYISINLFLAFYPNGRGQAAGRRCGILALNNMIFLYTSPGISFLSDLLGVRLRNCHQWHRAAAWMTCGQASLHIITSMETNINSISLQRKGIIPGIIVSNKRQLHHLATTRSPVVPPNTLFRHAKWQAKANHGNRLLCHFVSYPCSELRSFAGLFIQYSTWCTTFYRYS